MTNPYDFIDGNHKYHVKARFQKIIDHFVINHEIKRNRGERQHPRTGMSVVYQEWMFWKGI
jgi:hypothetical protein